MFKKHAFWQIKKSNILLGFLIFIIMCSFFQKKENHTSSANYILVFTHTKNIIKELKNSINCVDTLNVSNLKKLKTSYFTARAIYKEIENCIEYQSSFEDAFQPLFAEFSRKEVAEPTPVIDVEALLAGMISEKDAQLRIDEAYDSGFAEGRKVFVGITAFHAFPVESPDYQI